MRINILSINFQLTDQLQKRIEQRIHHIFREVRRDVTRITLRIVNETKSSLDNTIHCQIQVQMRCLPMVYSEFKSEDVYLAIDAAINRSQKRVARKLNKFNILLGKLKTLKKQKVRAQTLTLNKNQPQPIGKLA